MIETYDGIKVGMFKYDMPEGFQESAISYVTEICRQPNMFLNIVPNAPVASLWNDNESDKRLYKLPLFSDFIGFVKPHLVEYLNSLGINESDAFVVGMWAVHYKPTQYVIKHNHVYSDCSDKHNGSIIQRKPHIDSTENDMISVLLYLNKPNNSGNLFIETPNGKEHEFDLKQGDVIMFPSYSLMHRTSPNESREDKFVIVLDLAMKWVTNEHMIGECLANI